MSEELNYEPVNQLYVGKQRDNGAASQWQVDTSMLKQIVEHKIKGWVKQEIEYKVYTINNHKGEIINTILAIDDREALGKLGQMCDARNISLLQFDIKQTEETEVKLETKRLKKPLLPDDVCDMILVPLEPVFSQVGYLTKFKEEHILSSLFRLKTTVRKRLFDFSQERDDINPTNFDLVCELIHNMIEEVLRASQDGWTGERLSNIMQEKIITSSDRKGISNQMSSVFK